VEVKEGELLGSGIWTREGLDGKGKDNRDNRLANTTKCKGHSEPRKILQVIHKRLCQGGKTFAPTSEEGLEVELGRGIRKSF